MSEGSDTIPYPCRPDSLSHPGRLGVSVLLDGRSPALPHECAVLELGCADASHLLPLAARYPDSRFVGVERSPAAAGRAREAARALGLSNLEIRLADLRSLDPDELGTFDFVVAHGLLSWVAPDVRQALLEVAARCLGPRGALYLSYNARPGWAVRGELRSMMRSWTAGVRGAHPRVARAREGLEALHALLSEADGDYGRLLRGEVARALGVEDGYLLHEYLAEHNQPFDLSEVVALAADAGLRFAGELTRASADGVRELVAAQRLLTGGAVDPAAVTQTLDLLLCRQHRRSVFAPADVAADRVPLAARIESVHLFGRVRPTGEVDLDEGAPASFATASDATLTLEHAIVKAAVLELCERPFGTISYPDLVLRAAARLSAVAASSRVTDVAGALAEPLATLVGLGYIDAWTVPVAPRGGGAPTPLARHELATHGWVSTALHDAIRLTGAQAAAFEALGRGAEADPRVARELGELGLLQSA